MNKTAGKSRAPGRVPASIRTGAWSSMKLAERIRKFVCSGECPDRGMEQPFACFMRNRSDL